MKKIVIIGASYLQQPLIDKVHELGFEAHVFAWQCGDVGEKTADRFYPISIVEKEQILEVCRKIKPDAVCTISTDLGAVTANYVANALGLPANPSESMIPASNKYVMRCALRDAGISVPGFVRIRQGESASSVGELEYPLIVKPTDRSGSRGVSKINSPAELAKALENAWSCSFEKTAIAEEYLDGDEYSCESASFRGVHHIVTFTKKYTTGAPSFIENGHLQPSDLSAEQREKAASEIVRALDALHITDGISHSELKVNSRGEIKIIEIGARMGGDFIGSHLVRLSTGVDFVRAALDISLGIEPKLEKKEKESAAAVRFILSRDDVEYLERLKKSAPELIYEQEVQLEDIDSTVTDSSTRHGYVILHGDSAEEIRSALELG